MLLPEGNLISWLVFLWDQVGRRVQTQVTLEVSLGHVRDQVAIVVEVLAIDASAEAHVVAWLHHLGQLHGLPSKDSLSYDSRQHFFLINYLSKILKKIPFI